MAGERPDLGDRRQRGWQAGVAGELTHLPFQGPPGADMGASSIGWYTPRTSLASMTSRAGVQDMVAGR